MIFKDLFLSVAITNSNDLLSRKLFIAVLIFLIIIPFQNAFGDWQSLDGPYGGDIMCIKTYDSTLIAGTWGSGIYLSFDKGKKWIQKNNGLSSLRITSLEVQYNKIIAGTYDAGVFISDDYGDNWIAKNNGFSVATNNSIGSLAVNDSVIYAGTWGGLYFSTDLGESWLKVKGDLEYLNIISIYMKDSSIVVATKSDGIFISSDKGISWNEKNSGLTNDDIRTLTVKDSIIIVGTSPGIFISTNFGESWSPSGNLIPNSIPNAAIIIDDTIFIYLLSNGLYKSTDVGQTWEFMDNIFQKLRMYINVFAVVNDLLFAGTDYYGIYVSDDNCNSWVNSSSGLDKISLEKISISDSGIFATTLNQVLYYSKDFGNNWELKFDLLQNISTVSSYNNYVFLGSKYGSLKMTSDNGKTWESKEIVKSEITKIIMKENHQISLYDLYVCTSGSGLFYSTDMGENWGVKNLGLTNQYLTALEFNNANMYLGTVGGGLFVSHDNGSNWIQKRAGLKDLWVKSIAVKGSDLFVGTPSGVFYTSDEGDTWIEKNDGLTYKNVQSLIVVDDILMAGTDKQGVFLSVNKANTWNIYNQGLDNAKNIKDIKSHNGFVYISTEKGIFKIDINTISDVKDLKSNNIFNVYPNPAEAIIETELLGDYFGLIASEIRIYNNLGELMPIDSEKIIFVPSDGKIKIDISDLRRGFYVISIRDKFSHFVKL